MRDGPRQVPECQCAGCRLVRAERWDALAQVWREAQQEGLLK